MLSEKLQNLFRLFLCMQEGDLHGLMTSFRNRRTHFKQQSSLTALPSPSVVKFFFRAHLYVTTPFSLSTPHIYRLASHPPKAELSAHHEQHSRPYQEVQHPRIGILPKGHALPAIPHRPVPNPKLHRLITLIPLVPSRPTISRRDNGNGLRIQDTRISI